MMPTTIRMIPIIPAGFMKPERLWRTASRNQINDQDDDGDNQDQVDERATKMADETEEPENQENNEDSPEHMFSFGLVLVLCTGFLKLNAQRLERPAPSDQLDDQHDHRGQENEVN